MSLFRILVFVNNNAKPSTRDRLLSFEVAHQNGLEIKKAGSNGASAHLLTPNRKGRELFCAHAIVYPDEIHKEEIVFTFFSKCYWTVNILFALNLDFQTCYRLLPPGIHLALFLFSFWKTKCEGLWRISQARKKHFLQQKWSVFLSKGQWGYTLKPHLTIICQTKANRPGQSLL